MLIAQPLSIAREQVDELMDALDNALTERERDLGRIIASNQQSGQRPAASKEVRGL